MNSDDIVTLLVEANQIRLKQDDKSPALGVWLTVSHSLLTKVPSCKTAIYGQ